MPPDAFVLMPQQTLTQNVRFNLTDLFVEDGMARGLIVINQVGGGVGDIEGDYFRIDFSNDFAAGDRLMRPEMVSSRFLFSHLPCFQRLEEMSSRAGRFLSSVCHDFGDLRQASRRLWSAFCNAQFASRRLWEVCGNPRSTSGGSGRFVAIRDRRPGRSESFRQSAEGEEDAPERFFVASQHVQDALGRLLKIPINVQDPPERMSGLPKIVADAPQRRCAVSADGLDALDGSTKAPGASKSLEWNPSYFEDESVFPRGSVAFDCALLMRGIDHEWQGREDLCCPASAAA